MSQILKGYVVAITSLFAGAAVVHNIFKPDLVRVIGSLLHRASDAPGRPRAQDLCWIAPVTPPAQTLPVQPTTTIQEASQQHQQQQPQPATGVPAPASSSAGGGRVIDQ